MAKRVSLKGKGADIFFGEYAPPGMSEPEASVVDASATDTPESAAGLSGAASADANPLAPTTADSLDQGARQAAPLAEESHASKHASMLVGRPARIRASKKDGARGVVPDEGAASAEQAEVQGDVFSIADIAGDVWTRIDMPATITNSFRYTESELSTLTDVLYEVGKLHGAKLTKQDVARLGLNVILDEYRRRGAGSLLGKLAARRRQRRGGGS